MSDKYRHECPEGCKVFVGNLDRNIGRDQMASIFGHFGRVIDVWLATNPPGFGFVMYDQPSHAVTAVEQMRNRRIGSRVITVELATGKPRFQRLLRYGGRSPRNDSRCPSRDRQRHHTPSRSPSPSPQRRRRQPSPVSRRRCSRSPVERRRRSRSRSRSHDKSRRHERRQRSRHTFGN